MFEGIKRKYREHQEDRKYQKELDVDMGMRDEMYRQQARQIAREEFDEERKKIVLERKQHYIDQEKTNYDKQRVKLRDTRTTSDKFQGGMKKLGCLAKKGFDSIPAQDGRGQGKQSGFMKAFSTEQSGKGFNIDNALNKSVCTIKNKKQNTSNSMSDRILRNL
jgi:hypothetical protein